MRLHCPHPEAVWLDEANTILMAGRPPVALLDALTRDGNPPLYYVILHYWMVLFGDGERSVRSLSAILGASLSPALYLAALRLAGRTAAAVSGLLALAFPLHVYYSQQARMYSLLPVLALGFVVAFLEAVTRADKPLRRWLLVVLAGIAVIWTHNYGLFLVAAAPFAFVLCGPRTAVATRRLGLALAAIGLLDLLWLPVVVRQAASGVGAWIAKFFEPGTAALHSLLLFGAGYDAPLYLQALGGESPAGAASVAWFLAAAIVAIVFGLREKETRRPVAALLAFTLVPIAIPYAVSLMRAPIFLVGRYELVAYPGFALAVGAGAQALVRHASRWRALAIGVVFVLVVGYGALTFVTLARYFRAQPQRVEEVVAQILAQSSRPGDVVLTTGLSRAPIEYYLRRFGLADRLRIESFPGEIAMHLGWYDGERMIQDSARLGLEAHDLIESLRGLPGSVFLVDHTGSMEMARIHDSLRAALEGASVESHSLFRFAVGANVQPIYRVVEYRLRS